MLYVDSRKSLEGRREKNIIILPSATKKHSQQHYFVECKQKTLGKIINLPSVKKKTHGIPCLCRVSLTDTRQSSNGRAAHPTAVTWPSHAQRTCLYFCRVSMFAECFGVVCRVFFIWHSVKLGFAECYMFVEC